MPFANLVTETKTEVPRLYLNLSKPGDSGMLGWVMGMGRNVDLTRPTDIQIRQKCDETTKQIVGLMGWSEDFNNIKQNVMTL